MAAAARLLEERSPGYLDKVRSAASRLGRRGVEAAGVADALAALADLSSIDVDVPTASRQRGAHLVKVAVKRSTGWYLRYVGQQVSGFASAVTRLGVALDDQATRLATRTEALEASTGRLRSDVGRLEQAVRRLEDTAARTETQQ